MNADFKNKKVIFYDGDCGFCNSSVQFILKKRKSEFYFIPLQSDLAKSILQKFNIQIEMDTIYFLVNDKIYNKSSAGLQITKHLKNLYPLLFAFYIVPKFMRDWVYNFIAKRRHKLRAGYCALPTVEEKKYFLQ